MGMAITLGYSLPLLSLFELLGHAPRLDPVLVPGNEHQASSHLHWVTWWSRTSRPCHSPFSQEYSSQHGSYIWGFPLKPSKAQFTHKCFTLTSLSPLGDPHQFLENSYAFVLQELLVENVSGGEETISKADLNPSLLSSTEKAPRNVTFASSTARPSVLLVIVDLG